MKEKLKYRRHWNIHFHIFVVQVHIQIVSDQSHFFLDNTHIWNDHDQLWLVLIVSTNCGQPGKLKWFINVVPVANAQDWLAEMDTNYRKCARCVGCLQFFSNRIFTSGCWSLSNLISVFLYCQNSFLLKYFLDDS